MNKYFTFRSVGIAVIAAISLLQPIAASAAPNTSVMVRSFTDQDLRNEVIGNDARNAIEAAKNQNIDCLAWDQTWETAAEALSAWAFFGTSHFCGDKVELNRSEGKKVWSPSGMPSDHQCRQAVGAHNRNDFVRNRHVDKWRMQRRGQTNYVMCNVHYVILD